MSPEEYDELLADAEGCLGKLEEAGSKSIDKIWTHLTSLHKDLEYHVSLIKTLNPERTSA